MGAHVLDTAERQSTGMKLETDKWHQPLVSIIVAHCNYSDYLQDALLSILAQTHTNWECVIVDDGSEPHHAARAEQIVNEIDSPKIRLVTKENEGQIPAFFSGLDHTTGEFVCLLDPDDRYFKTFLEEALRAHLNDTVVCPIVSTNQYLVKNNTVIASSVMNQKLPLMRTVIDATVIDPKTETPLLFFPSWSKQWHWSSTSALMYRRSALNLIRPHKKLTYKRAADAYLAQGCHILGGTICVQKPLIYRLLHGRNSWISDQIYSTYQDKKRERGEQNSLECLNDVREALLYNGIPDTWSTPPTPVPAPPPKDRRLRARLRRSAAKRLKWLRNKSLSSLIVTRKDVLVPSSASSYWAERKDADYLKKVFEVARRHSANAKSIIDIGSNGCPYLDWFDWIDERISLDLVNPYFSQDVKSIKVDFLKWKNAKQFDICLCLQVLEHIPDAKAFARKLLEISPNLVISVPYRWREGQCIHHVHDPVDEMKIYDWFGRWPNDTYIIADGPGQVKRLICYFQRA